MTLFRTIALTLAIAGSFLVATLYTSCKKDNCKNRVCLEGAVCTDGNCRCPVGFHGTLCETEDTLDPGRRTKFVRLWNALQTSKDDSTKTATYTCRIDYNTIDGSFVVIDSNFANHYFNHRINASVNGSDIIIDNQSPDGQTNAFISGYGIYDDAGRIEWNYIISNPTTGFNAKYKDLWQ